MHYTDLGFLFIAICLLFLSLDWRMTNQLIGLRRELSRDHEALMTLIVQLTCFPGLENMALEPADAIGRSLDEVPVTMEEIERYGRDQERERLIEKEKERHEEKRATMTDQERAQEDVVLSDDRAEANADRYLVLTMAEAMIRAGKDPQAEPSLVQWLTHLAAAHATDPDPSWPEARRALARWLGPPSVAPETRWWRRWAARRSSSPSPPKAP